MARNKKRDSGQQIIANMGLFWEKEKVRWKGTRSVGKSLSGRCAREKRAGEVDFWGQTGIYALYDADYHLIYVGQAGFGDKSYIGARLKHHCGDELAGRWDLFSWFGLRKVTGQNTLGRKSKRKAGTLTNIGNVLEAILIAVAEPPMNSQGGKFGRKVERYLQVDEGADKDAKSHEKILKELSKLSTKIKKIGRKIN
jgi:hypothetical protein